MDSAESAHQPDPHWQTEHSAPTRRLVICASFAADPIRFAADFWTYQLELPFQLELAPFSAIYPSPASDSGWLAAESDGLNVLMFRWQDLVSKDQSGSSLDRLVTSIAAATQAGKARLLVISCANSPQLLGVHGNERLDDEIAHLLGGMPTVDFVSRSQIDRWYPTQHYDTSAGSQPGGAPLSPSYFAALATLITRRIEALLRPESRVIALDGNSALWNDFPDQARRAVVDPATPLGATYAFLDAKRAAGWRVVVTSGKIRNPEELPQLAVDLGVNPSEMIFIGADKQANADVDGECPGVRTLVLPESEREIPGFLDHIWLFDRWNGPPGSSLNLPGRGATSYARIATELINPHVIARRAQPQSKSARALEPDDLPKTGLERQLAMIWADILGLIEIGIHDNFFEMGGSSLLAAQLLRRLVDTFANENLTLSSLLEAPTVEEFGALLETGGLKEYHSLVPMRAGGTRPPFYCIHGDGGNVLSLRDLAMAMPADQPFYCLQAAGLDGKTEPFTSVEETATHYVKEVRSFQGEGPYYIGGTCYGGLVAFEMARQLRQQGQEVGIVALIDTHNNAYASMMPKTKLVYYNIRFVLQRLVHHARRLGGLGSVDRKNYLVGRVRSMRSHLRGFASIITGGSRTQVVGSPAPGIAFDDAMHGGFHRTLMRVVEANLEAQRNFVPKVYEGSVTLFKAANPLVEPYQDRHFGWGPVVRGDIDAYVVPGEHADITEEPRVRILASLLEACLRKAQAVAAP
jgi:thioesterase domain-containing protein